jgi:microcin C transport system substrate-binding protein
MRLALLHPDTRKWVPGLAEEWAVDYEAKTVYVRLDPAARWSDGMPVTVEDMFFTFFMYQSPYILAPWYNNWYTRSYTNITRYDDHTLSISLPEDKPDMLGRALGLEPLPKHFFKDFGPDFPERYQWEFVPTSGAYEVRAEDVRKGRSIALRRVDWWAQDKKFWRNRYNYERINWDIVHAVCSRHLDDFRAFAREVAARL